MEAPSVIDVNTELKKARIGPGLTVLKAMSLRHIPYVPAVEDSLRRSGHSDGHRTSVTIAFLKCVLKPRDESEIEWSDLVTMALNIDGKLPGVLGDREHDFMYRKEWGKSKYSKARDKAFADLAEKLVTLKESPCKGDRDADALDQARILDLNKLDVDEHTAQLLLSVWTRLIFGNPANARERLHEMVEALPGVSKWINEDSSDSLHIIKAMMRRVLDTEYRRWYKVLGQKEDLLAAGTFLSLLDRVGHFPDPRLEVVDFVDKALHPDMYTWIPTKDVISTRQYMRTEPMTPQERGKIMMSVAKSYRICLRILQLVETLRTWSWIPRPEDSVVPAKSPIASL